MRPFLGWVCGVLWMGSAGFAWLVVEADDSADGVVDYSEFLAACVSVAWGQCGTGSAGASANGCQLGKRHEPYEAALRFPSNLNLWTMYWQI